MILHSPDSRLFKPGAITHEAGLFNEHGEFDGANEALTKLVGEHLGKHYPGHPWGVSSEIEHGIVRICLQGFAQWPVIIHVASLKGDSSMRAVTRHAGELLERLKMPRKGFSLTDWQTANRALPAHFNRNKKAPV